MWGSAPTVTRLMTTMTLKKMTLKTMTDNDTKVKDDLMRGSAPTVSARDLLSFGASTNSHSATDTLQVVMIMVIMIVLIMIMLIMIMMILIMQLMITTMMTNIPSPSKKPTLRRTPCKL